MREMGALLLAVITVSGCGTQGALDPGDVHPTVQSGDVGPQQPKVTPRLWIDEDAAAMIEVMSDFSDPGDMVYVIRWEHSGLRGWVTFESQKGSTPLSYDLSASSALSNVPSADIVSGWLIVAMHRLLDTPGEAYDVRIEEWFRLRKGNEGKTMRFDTRRGTLLRVPPNTDPDNWDSRQLSNSGMDYVELQKLQDGESVSWLELGLGTTPSEPQANAEQSTARERD